MTTQQIAGAVRVKTIVIQHAPRLDSLGALFLIQRTRAGEKAFPGCKDATIEFWGTGTASGGKKRWQENLKEGVLMLGVGGSPFDEHPSAEFGDRKKEQKSTMKLVAEHLHLDKDPLFKRLVDNVTKNDLEGAQGPLDLSNIVKAMHRSGGNNPENVIGFAFEAFDALLGEQHQFLLACKEVESAAWRRTITCGNRKLDIELICSDNTLVARAARHLNNRLAVLIQVRASGRTQILTNAKCGLCMSKVASALRRAELTKMGMPSSEIEKIGERMSAPGQLKEIPTWCYQMPGENLLNGSETARDVEPTHLKVEEVFEIICANIMFKQKD